MQILDDHQQRALGGGVQEQLHHRLEQLLAVVRLFSDGVGRRCDRPTQLRDEPSQQPCRGLETRLVGQPWPVRGTVAETLHERLVGRHALHVRASIQAPCHPQPTPQRQTAPPTASCRSLAHRRARPARRGRAPTPTSARATAAAAPPGRRTAARPRGPTPVAAATAARKRSRKARGTLRDRVAGAWTPTPAIASLGARRAHHAPRRVRAAACCA